MSKEALRTQLDALQIENQRLQAENAKLRDGRPDGAARIDAEAEINRLEELVRKLQDENAAANSTVDAVEARIQELSETAGDRTTQRSSEAQQS
jgi:cell division protein FtsB